MGLILLFFCKENFLGTARRVLCVCVYKDGGGAKSNEKKIFAIHSSAVVLRTLRYNTPPSILYYRFSYGVGRRRRRIR